MVQVPKVPSQKNVELKLDILRILLESKSSVAYDVYNENGDTAIMHAARNWRAGFDRFDVFAMNE